MVGHARGWMVLGSNPYRGARFFSSPKRPDRLSGPTRLVFSGYWGLLPGGTVAGA